MNQTQELRAINFVPGCNTPSDQTRAQLMQNVQRDLPWLETEPLKNRPLIIVAGGPSLKYRWPEIWNYQNADVMALNNAYPFLIEKNIIPNYFMLLDARVGNVDFLRSASLFTRHLIAAQCHPDVFEALRQHNTTLYLTTLPDTLELTEGIDKPKVRLAGAVGTVGMKALSMAYALGYRELHLFGYDSSYEGSEHHGFEQKLNDAAKTLEVYLDGKKYVTTPTLAHQVEEFCYMTKQMTAAHGFDIQLHCDGLLPAMVDFANRRGSVPLEEREQQKYKTMWENDQYRKHSPGLFHVKHAIEKMGIRKYSTIIDFGCGSGKAAQAFHEDGYKVTGIDFADNCRDAECMFPFVQSCLWKLPDIKADFGFCTDVMEHIPTEKVEETLASIAKCVDNIYFNISTVDDNFGSLIGYKLHMTIMVADNWEKLLQKYWKKVECYEGEKDSVFVCSNSTT